MAREIHDRRVDLPLITGDERVADSGQKLSAHFLGLFIRFVDVYLPQIGNVLSAGFVSLFSRGVVVKLESLLGGLQLGGQQYQRVPVLGRPLDSLYAHG